MQLPCRVRFAALLQFQVPLEVLHPAEVAAHPAEVAAHPVTAVDLVAAAHPVAAADPMAAADLVAAADPMAAAADLERDQAWVLHSSKVFH